MERTDKDKSATTYHSHCFPSIKHDSKKADTSDECFRPMFQASPENPNATPAAPCGDQDSGNRNDPLEVALKKSFERGVEAGNKDACGIAQKELKPSLNRLFSKLNSFSDSLSRVTQEYSSQIISLSMAIVEKIMGSQSIRTADEKKAIHTALDESFSRHYHLNLLLNNEDLEELADLMSCQNIQISDNKAVHIGNDDTIQRGASRHAAPDPPFEEWQKRFADNI